MRLIDADNLPHYNGYSYSALEIARAVEKAQTIDAVPVVHGHWIVGGRRTTNRTEIKCSVCGVSFMISPMELEWLKDTEKFCCRCGTRMDGGNEYAAD